MRIIRSTVVIGVALLLAVFLQPPTSEGQAPPPPTSTDFEYDILPGIQQANRLSNGWHELQTARGGWTDWLALDFVAEAQSPPDAPDVHEVLPGIQPGYDGPLTSEEAARRYFVSTDIRMTCGWHATCAYYIDADGNQRPPLPDYGIDMAYLTAGEVAGKRVWAALQAVDVSGGDLTARVKSVHRPGDGSDCMSVEVDVLTADLSPIAVLRYSHTIPGVAEGDSVAIADIRGEIAMTLVGRVARPNDENGVVDLDEDGIGCKTGGAHLHQSRGRGSDVSWLQRNRDTTDATVGFPDPPAPNRVFCSDTWIFRIQPGAASATAVAACPAARYQLTLAAGANGSLSAAPAAETTGYLSGTAVTVTATPHTGYQIASWGGACTATGTDDTTCELIMDAAKTASVTFTADAPPTPTAPPRPPPRPDPYVWIQLVTGVNTVVWPGATILTATITEDIPISIIWYWDADAGETGEWISYVTNPDAPAATKRLKMLRTGETYVIRATEDYAWRVRRPASSRSARAQVAETPSEPGWTATVTCASGFGPIRLRAAPTEAEAITAANWIIDHPHGCAGSGIYTISDESGGG